MPHLTSTRTFAMHGVQFHSYASSAFGSARLAAWRAEFAPRTPGQPHRMSHEEVLHVLSGTLQVEVEHDRFTARAGDGVLVPANALFRVSNDADDPAEVWVTTELGMTATMEADGTAVQPPWAQ